MLLSILYIVGDFLTYALPDSWSEEHKARVATFQYESRVHGAHDIVYHVGPLINWVFSRDVLHRPRQIMYMDVFGSSQACKILYRDAIFDDININGIAVSKDAYAGGIENGQETFRCSCKLDRTSARLTGHDVANDDEAWNRLVTLFAHYEAAFPARNRNWKARCPVNHRLDVIDGEAFCTAEASQVFRVHKENKNRFGVFGRKKENRMNPGTSSHSGSITATIVLSSIGITGQ